MNKAELLQAFSTLIDASSSMVAFTGAGISTESGIPDFRGPQGVWKTQTPIDFNDFVSSESWRRKAWERKFSGEDKMTKATPNSGHYALERWISEGKMTHIITQNVDGLHQASGVADSHVIELHGNAQYAKCLACDKRFELEPLKTAFLEQDTIPFCDQCGGIVKTATISFGQSMPESEMGRAHAASIDCDLFLAIGSSLTVYPAAGFPVLAKKNGAKLVIINHQDTDLDPIADLVIQEGIGEVLSIAAGLNR